MYQLFMRRTCNKIIQHDKIIEFDLYPLPWKQIYSIKDDKIVPIESIIDRM